MPDPKVSIGLNNLPTDGFSLDQEGMTQLKLGVSQLFTRGDSLAIKAKQLDIASSRYPLLAEDRKAKLKSLVSQFWLDAYLAQKTIELIEKDRALFEQMAEVAKASYSNVVGKTSQHDVIRAQLELIQLEDRLTVEQQKLEMSLTKLNEWLHTYHEGDQINAYNFEQPIAHFKLPAKLPVIQLKNAIIFKPENYSRNKVADILLNHPAIRVVDISQQVAKKSIALAKQQYQPQWGVSASYGYRDDMPSGDSRADLFSVGVSFDLPLFTADKQDQQVSASIAEAQAIKTDKLLLTKQMLSAIESEIKQLKRLSERQNIYQQQLLKQTYEQAEASLTAYTNDEGDFSEVVRARIAELNARVAALQIDIEALKAVVRINYYFTEHEFSQTARATSSNFQQHGAH